MEHTSPGLARSRGLLHQTVSMAHFDLTRIEPGPALRDFVENYWIIDWDLTGRPDYTQSNLPHPSQHLVIDTLGNSGIFGIQTGTFVHTLTGSGHVFGVKFHPGAFRPIYRQPVSGLTDTHIVVSDLFGGNDRGRESRLVHSNDPRGMAGEIEEMILSCDPVLDDRARDARRLVILISETPEIISVAKLARVAGRSARSLQRLFENYVGVGPKWVIDRYRMLAAVDALNRNEPVNLTELSYALGYFDQAHFSRAFQALTGKPPSHYRAS